MAELKSAPGTKSFYSNFGFGLLGHLLSVKAGKSYEALVRELVCAPLAMSNTIMTLSDEQKPRFTPGHSPKGVVVPNWEFDALAGCGAFKSTVNDLLKLTTASLQDGPDATSRAIAETRRIHFPEFAGGIGLAWQIRKPVEGQHWHWHNGGTGGYVSFVGFDKLSQVGVVILSNYGDAMAGDNSVDLIGVEILRLLPKISLE
jgi:CubicO group peptidase (beta-lactamase class C family)